MPGFGEKVARIAADTRTQARKAADAGRLGAAIRRERAALEDDYTRLGKGFYEACRAGEEGGRGLEGLLADIGERLERIEDYRRELAKARGAKLCPDCGAQTELDARFCSRCGHRYGAEGEKGQPDPPPPEADRVTPACPGCGAPLTGDPRYCDRCGYRRQ